MLGIMSGRLSPPVEDKIQAFPFHNWREEFAVAKKLGLECIEWIYEIPNVENNPITTDSGISELKRLSEKHEVKISSLVADNFMFEKFFGTNKIEVKQSRRRLNFLIQQAGKAGIPLLELPLMGNAAIKDQKARTEVLENLMEALVPAEKLNVVLSLELDLPPFEILSLMQKLDHPNIGINYDMGNSTVFGFDPAEEIDTFGRYIVNVHIKDGIIGGGTVPLGTGDTDFDTVFAHLEKAAFQGDFILQAAREDLADNPVERTITETVSDYIDFVRRYIPGE